MTLLEKLCWKLCLLRKQINQHQHPGKDLRLHPSDIQLTLGTKRKTLVLPSELVPSFFCTSGAAMCADKFFCTGGDAMCAENAQVILCCLKVSHWPGKENHTKQNRNHKQPNTPNQNLAQDATQSGSCRGETKRKR